MGRSRQRRGLSRARRRHRLARIWPERHFTLVESNGKKAAFLRAAIRATGANATVAAERIEAHAAEDGGEGGHRLGAGARAASGAPRARRALSCTTASVMLFLKGRDYVQEIEAASQSFAFDVVDYAERDGFGRSRSRHPQSPPKEAAAMNISDRLPERPRVLALANQKGGVGKTTTAINLGTALAAIDETVLIVDIDPQGNASTGLGVERDPERASRPTTCWSARRRSRRRRSRPPCRGSTSCPRRSICSASSLRSPTRRTGISGCARRSRRCRWSRSETAYQLHPVDCPPSLNLLTINAMAASHAVLVPLQCEFFALEGLSQILSTVERVRAGLNPQLTIHGIVLTMFDGRNKLSGQVVDDVRAHMGDKVYRTVIPRNVRISEAPSHGKPALLYDLKCAGSQAYLRLASEIIQRERTLRAA